MSSRDASWSDGSSKVQELELLSGLPRLRRGVSTCDSSGWLDLLVQHSRYSLSQRWPWHLLWGTISQSIMCDRVVQSNASSCISQVPLFQSYLWHTTSL